MNRLASFGFLKPALRRFLFYRLAGISSFVGKQIHHVLPSDESAKVATRPERIRYLLAYPAVREHLKLELAAVGAQHTVLDN